MEFVGPLAATSPIIRRAAYSRLLTVLAMVVVGAVCPPFDASLQLPATQSAGVVVGGGCRAIFVLGAVQLTVCVRTFVSECHGVLMCVCVCASHPCVVSLCAWPLPASQRSGCDVDMFTCPTTSHHAHSPTHSQTVEPRPCPPRHCPSGCDGCWAHWRPGMACTSLPQRPRGTPSSTPLPSFLGTP